MLEFIISAAKWVAALSPHDRWVYFWVCLVIWITVGAIIGVIFFFVVPRIALKPEAARESRTVTQSVSIAAPPVLETTTESPKPANAGTQPAVANTSSTISEAPAAQQTVASPLQIGEISQTAPGVINAPVSNITAPIVINYNVTIQQTEKNEDIKVDDELSYSVRTFKAKTKKGGEADIKIYMLFDSAAWSYGSSSELISIARGNRVSFYSFLENAEFLKDAKNFNAIVCLGLASSVSQGNISQTIALTDERATYLCGLVSRKIHTGASKTKVFGLPLGYHENSSVNKNTNDEKKQRSVVILGVRAASGDLATDAEQRELISLILEKDVVDDFRFSAYSEILSKKPLRYMRIERGVYGSFESGVGYAA